MEEKKMAQKFKEGQTGNFGKANLESIDKFLREPMPDYLGMFLNESGRGVKTIITEESRKKCAKSLIR